MLNVTLFLCIIIVLVLLFDYINGFHDSANAIATVVSTRVMTPRTAIVMAAVLNFVGAVFSTSVAKTIAGGLVDPAVATQTVVLSAIVGAIAWNLITWFYGIPSSSSHALIGGLVGAALIAGGPGSLILLSKKANEGLVPKVLIPLFSSPVLGLIVGFIIMTVIYLVFQKYKKAITSAVFKRLQVLSAATMAFAHGQNDAQKSMGLITMALVSAGVLAKPDIPLWVVLSCAIVMALGTAAGGWRIIKTMGHKIISLEPVSGFAAETTAASILLTTAHMGMPVSTTHAITTSIMGVGLAKKDDEGKSVCFGTAGRILFAWVLTIPATFLIAYVLRKITM